MDERLKQSIESARGAANTLKKRAALEEEYAHGLKKLARSSMSDYSGNDVRAGYVHGLGFFFFLTRSPVLTRIHVARMAQVG